MSANHAAKRLARGVRRVMALPVASERLGIAGDCDMVEFPREGGAEVPFPVEYKRGKPKLHRADDVQLCAQALCLEEMTGLAVPSGALFYAETHRRTPVPFDDDGRPEFSAKLSETAQSELRWHGPIPLTDKHRARLVWHRTEVFEVIAP